MSGQDRDGSEGPEPVMDPAEYHRRRAEAAARQEGRLVIPTAQTAALKHGLYSQRLSYLPCDVCKLQDQCEQYQPGQQCPLERAWMEYRRPLVAQAIQEAGRDPELHAAQITAAVHAEIRYHRNWGYMLVDGEVWPDPKQQGMLEETPSSKRVDRLRREVDKAFEELGLSPRALAKLEAGKQQGPVMAATILALGQPGGAASGEPVDAEFEAAEGTAERGERREAAENAENGDTAGKGQGAKGKGERQTAELEGQGEQDGEDVPSGGAGLPSGPPPDEGGRGVRKDE